jgi:hypothetical protein
MTRAIPYFRAPRPTAPLCVRRGRLLLLRNHVYDIESFCDTNPASARNDFKCVSEMYILLFNYTPQRFEELALIARKDRIVNFHEIVRPLA